MLISEYQQRLSQAIRELGRTISINDYRLADEDVNLELRNWLDGNGVVIDWTLPAPQVTADEWFFITTLYGEMTIDGQRTHIRKFYPTLFRDAASRDIRNFVPSISAYLGLRSTWMKQRLVRMAEILKAEGLSMEEYAGRLKQVETTATPASPTPALDMIVKDHRATGWKTLSVFVRDYVEGNCFPIDSRVAKVLNQYELPLNERLLVSLSLELGRNPRTIARLFYSSGTD